MFEEEAVKHYNNLTKSALRLNEIVKEQQKEIEEYQKELEKADSLTQSCIFEGSKSAGKTYRQCLNMLEKQQQRINRAIEYIETNANYDENIKQCRDNLYDCECDDLLEILKGVQDERTTNI